MDLYMTRRNCKFSINISPVSTNPIVKKRCLSAPMGSSRHACFPSIQFDSSSHHQGEGLNQSFMDHGRSFLATSRTVFRHHVTAGGLIPKTPHRVKPDSKATCKKDSQTLGQHKAIWSSYIHMTDTAH